MLPEFDAVVLAGGRSARLGGVPKALLEAGGEPLLLRTLRALHGARRIAVVGPAELAPLLAAAGNPPDAPASHGGPRIVLTREDPPFAGPAAAVAAGFESLAGPERAPLTMLLACDMPGLAGLPERLAQLAAAGDGEAWMPVDGEGKLQQLACCVRTDVLAAALARHRGGFTGLPVRVLLATVQITPVTDLAGSTADVDTWADAERWGIQRPA